MYTTIHVYKFELLVNNWINLNVFLYAFEWRPDGLDLQINPEERSLLDHLV